MERRNWFRLMGLYLQGEAFMPGRLPPSRRPEEAVLAFGNSLHGQDLARIEDVLRIERLLNHPHETHALAVLKVHELGLAIANAVLAGAGAFQGDGAADQT